MQKHQCGGTAPAAGRAVQDRQPVLPCEQIGSSFEVAWGNE